MNTIDPTIRQAKPKGTGVDVATLAEEDILLHQMMTAEEVYRSLINAAGFLRFMLGVKADENLLQVVAHDLEARVEMGATKYGARLQTNNGRDAIMDAYQEVLDGINYLKQALLENKFKDQA